MNRTLNIIKEKTAIAISWTDMAVCSWYVYVAARALTDTTYPCFDFLAGATVLLALYWVLRILFAAAKVKEAYIVMGIVAWAIYELICGIWQLTVGHSNHYLYAMTGSFLNPGPYSASLALGLVMICHLKKELTKDIHIYKGIRFSHVLTGIILSFVMVLPATWGRAAILSAAICICLIYRNELKRWKWWILSAALAFTGMMYILKCGSANGRFAINYISSYCIADSPFTGNGIGSFFHSYAEKTAELSTNGALPFDAVNIDVLDYAFNDFMLVAVEQGIIGLGFAATLLFFVFKSLLRKSRSLAYGLLSLLLFSLFSYPFELLPYQIIAIIIIAFSANNDKGVRINAVYIIIIAILISLMPLSEMRTKQKAEEDYKLMAGMSHAAFTDDYYELLPLLGDNKNFLFDFGKMLSAQGRYNDSNAMLRQGTRLSNDPMFHVIQGNNYSEMGFYREAEQAYRKAFAIMPNRLYPLYKLMLLYEKEGEKGKMIDMAKRVVGFKEKIASPATREMKDKARESLNKATPARCKKY